MALIGLGTVSLFAMIMAYRSKQAVKTLIIVGMWAVMAAHASGMIL